MVFDKENIMNNVVKICNDRKYNSDFNMSALLSEGTWFDLQNSRKDGYTVVDIQSGETIIFVSKLGINCSHSYTVKEDIRVNLQEPIRYHFEGESKEEGSLLNDWYVFLNEDGFCLDEKLARNTTEDEEPCTAGSLNPLPKLTEQQIQDTVDYLVNSVGGIKFDTQKTQPGLLYKDLVNASAAVIRVLDLGAKKYSRANYLKVEDVRYEEAMLRHLQAYFQGEAVDPESGESHLAHVVCCVMFMLEKKARGINL
jgi:hypothetical protein